MIKVLQDIEQEDGKAGADAASLLKSISTFSFFFIVLCLDAVFSVINILSQYLQEKTMTFSRARTCTKSILSTLSQFRNDQKFESLWKVASEKQAQLELEPPTLPRHRRIPRRIDDGEAENEQYSSVEAYFRRSYCSMLDILISEINQRFSENSYSVLTALEALLLDSFTCLEPKAEHLPEVVGFYGDEFVSEKLKSELMVLYGFVKSISPPCSRGHEEKSVDDLISLFLEHSCYHMLPEISKLMKLYLVVPVSSANAERSFSVLRRTKTWLRSTMREERLSALALCNIEKEVTNSLSLDDLLDQFCSAKDRRLPLK